MPWTVDDPPSVAKNWTSAQKKKCVAAANAVLEDGGTEEDAIFACIHAAGKSKRKGSKQSMAAKTKEKKAQEARAKRYGISIREEDGNVTRPGEWESLSDSQFGDPVNYLYPVPDKKHAISAKSYFAQHSDKYDDRSRAKVRARINRLARKYKVKPIANSDEVVDDIELAEDVGAHRFFAMFDTSRLSDEAVDDDHEGLIRIPAARNTTLEHPWWGTIYLDDDLFESFIDNWATSVVGYDLAIDPDHDPHQGALAWIEDITYDGETFDLWVKPTYLGIGVLGDVWRYASIEFVENYRDPETQVDYGPTLLGCGATNRPFVHRQNAIAVLSKSGPGCDGLECSLLKSFSDGVEKMEVLFDDTEGVIDGAETDDQESAVNEVVEQVESLSQPEPVTSQKTEETEEEQPHVTEQPITASAPVTIGGMTFTQADIEGLLSQNATLLARDRERTIAEACDTALSRGVAPVVVETARQILGATEPLAQATITLSVPGDGGVNVKKSVNLFSAVVELLKLVPGRITDMPLSYAYDNQDEAPHSSAKTGNPYMSRVEETTEEAEEAAKKRRAELGIKYDRNLPTGDAVQM